jgi:tetratricopeptide (TPR) repeat protein
LKFELTRRQKTLWALLLLTACCVVYANGIFGAFTYDDKAVVRDNPRIRSPRNVRQIFTTSYFGGPRGTGSAYRPLLLLSYAGQWWIHGKDVVAFHVVNVLFHAFATLLLAALLLRLDLPPPSVAASALLFAVHPIHVEAVTSLVGRGETQAAVFMLLYLHCALTLAQAKGEGRRARGEEEQHFRRLPPPASRLPALALAVLCYAAALLTKESAVVAPALAFLLLLYRAEGRLFRRLRDALMGPWPLWLLSAGVLAGTFRLRSWVLGGPLRARGSGVFEVENALAGLPSGARAVNACVIFFRYLGRCVFPLHLSGDESAWSIRRAPLLSPLALGATFLLVALLVAALARLPERSSSALGFLFFAVAFLPASNLLFPTGTIFAERLAYLPTVGICLILGSLLSRVVPASRGAAAPAQELPLPPPSRDALWRTSPGDTSFEALAKKEGRGEGATSVSVDLMNPVDRARFLPLLLLVLLFAGRTILRNAVWWTDEGLFANLITTSPDSAKAHYDVAYVAVANRRYPQALAEYSRAVSIYPRYWDAWAGRGRTLKEMGNLPEAERSYEKATAANPDYENGYFGLGDVREAEGNDAGAGEAYRRGLERVPNSLPLAYRLAQLESRTKSPTADAQWQRALRLGAHSAVVRAEHARWLAREGRLDEAAREAREAWRRDPANLTALRLLAEKVRAEGKTLAEELALERIYRITRSPEDLARLEELKKSSPAFSRRPRLPDPIKR